MTIECTQREVTYQGGGETSHFSIPFPVFEKKDLCLTIRNKEGTPVSMTEDVDFEWILTNDNRWGPSSVDIKLRVPLPSGWTMHICRIVPLTQESMFTNQGPYSPKVVEQCFDKNVMVAQQLDDAVTALETGKASRNELDDLALRMDAVEKGDAPPARHAESHAIDGNDPIRLERIGALSREHTTQVNPHPQYVRHDDVEQGAFPPSNHAKKHMLAGSDQIHPNDIGALSRDHLTQDDPHPQYARHDEASSESYLEHDPDSNLLYWKKDIQGIGPAVDGSGSLGGPKNRLEEIYARTLIDTNRINVNDIATKATASSVANGLMSAKDKARLDGLYPSGTYTFYCNPDGDASLNTPGTKEAPFKSFAAALNALKKQYGEFIGTVKLLFEPGTYNPESMNLMGPALGPSQINLVAAVPASPPILRYTGRARIRGGTYFFDQITLQPEQGIEISECSYVTTNGFGLEVTGSAGKNILRVIESTWYTNTNSEIKIKTGDTSCDNVFFSQRSNFRLMSTTVTVDGLESFSCFARSSEYSNMYFNNMTFNNTENCTGKRYYINEFSRLTVYGAGEYYLPGTNNGYTDATSIYA